MPQTKLGKEIRAREFVALKTGAVSAIFIILGALFIGQVYGLVAERFFGVPAVWAFAVVNTIAPIALGCLVLALLTAWGPLARRIRRARSTEQLPLKW